jgi:flagellar basal-body rod modification protein FlgD
MPVSAINGFNLSDPTAAADAPSKVLTQDDFLKLLVAQMTSQDPINPMDNQDMLTQMVQFSTLQGNNSMQTALTQLQSNQSLLQANALLGRQVSLQVDDRTVTQGVVSAVDVSSGTAQIVVNGVMFDLSQVLAITTPSTNP